MDFTFGARLKKAWNAFLNRDPPMHGYMGGYSFPPGRRRMSGGSERSIVAAIYNRIAMDAASVQICHVQLDENGRFDHELNTGLARCFSTSANLDQTGRAFLHDVYLSMLDEGAVAIVPTVTDVDPRTHEDYEILELRCGRVTEWFPDKVRVELYNPGTGNREELILDKRTVAVVENPFYAVMNEPNGTMRRLANKLALLDVVDDKVGSDKLDLIIQLPYAVKGELRIKQAEERRRMLEEQMSNSRLGIGYIDGTEKVVQLNRSLENNLLKSVEYLTEMAYAQLGISQEILNGTADEKAMTNYMTRIVEVLVAAVADECRRKFISEDGREKRRESIVYFNDPFKLIPTSQIADIADKFGRNEIMSSNEFRQEIGLRPSKDPNADKLINKNMPAAHAEQMPDVPRGREMQKDQNGEEI